MKKQKLKLLMGGMILFLGIFFSSCKTENGVRESFVGESSYSLKNYIVTEEAVAKQAQELIALLDGGALRSVKRSVVSITPIGEQIFRSTQGETTHVPKAYVVNFANDLGYAVLSADARLEPVWVLSEKGNLDTKKSLDNPTALMMMKQVELAYNMNRYQLIDRIEGWSPDRPIEPVEPTRIEYGPWTHIPETKFEALVPVVWGQSEKPYNLYIPKNLSSHAGCVPTAVAQIMAFHRYPRFYSWNEMIKHHPLSNPTEDYLPAYDQIGRLYRDLGKSLRVQYAPDGSGAYSEDVPKTFLEFGYANGGVLSNFSFNTVQKELSKANGKGYPLYISASDTMEVKYQHFLWWDWKEVSYNGGHAFVIDGVSKVQRLVREINVSTGEEVSRRYETLDLLHANLGWNTASHNGYYNKNVFDTNNGPLLQSMTNSIVGKSKVYRYNFKVITGIRP